MVWLFYMAEFCTQLKLRYAARIQYAIEIKVYGKNLRIWWNFFMVERCIQLKLRYMGRILYMAKT